MMGAETVVAAIIVIGALVAALIGIIKAVRAVSGFFEKFDKFFGDWYGEDARPGFEARPGVLTRLHSLEDFRGETTSLLRDIKSEVAKTQQQVIKELNRNGGSSTKDAAYEAMRMTQDIRRAQEQQAVEFAHFQAKYLWDQKAGRRELTSILEAMLLTDLSSPEQRESWTKLLEQYRNGPFQEDE